MCGCLFPALHPCNKEVEGARRESAMEVQTQSHTGRWRVERANKSELAVDGCCDSSESEQDRSCFELAVWTDGCLCANYRLSA